jgi:hypothetical protein
MSAFDFIAAGQQVIVTEQAALDTLKPYINEAFQQACTLILAAKGVLWLWAWVNLDILAIKLPQH